MVRFCRRASFGDYVRANSWREANSLCRSVAWENAQLAAQNDLTENFQRKHSASYQSWNVIGLELRPIIQPLVESKTASICAEHAASKEFVDSVRWDILGWAMELEFAGLVAPNFYATLGVLYLQGNFPCGWDGDFPAGRLIVY